MEQAGLLDGPGINNGPTTFKDVAAHLNGWRGLTLARLKAAYQRAGPPAHPWPAGMDENTRAGVDLSSAWFHAHAREQDRLTTEVLAKLSAQFDALIATVAAMSDDDLLSPGRFGWLGNLPIGPALLGFSFTHLHTDHDPNIRAWLRREMGGEPVLPPAPPRFGYGE